MQSKETCSSHKILKRQQHKVGYRNRKGNAHHVNHSLAKIKAGWRPRKTHILRIHFKSEKTSETLF